MVEPSLEATSAVRDREDEHILACALGAKATVIVSGDNDLLVLDPFEEIRIVGPREFLVTLRVGRL